LFTPRTLAAHRVRHLRDSEVQAIAVGREYPGAEEPASVARHLSGRGVAAKSRRYVNRLLVAFPASDVSSFATRHGTTATMDVANIGTRSPEDEASMVATGGTNRATTSPLVAQALPWQWEDAEPPDEADPAQKRRRANKRAYTALVNTFQQLNRLRQLSLLEPPRPSVSDALDWLLHGSGYSPENCVAWLEGWHAAAQEWRGIVDDLDADLTTALAELKAMIAAGDGGTPAPAADLHAATDAR
jgi:hypothetical protein